ncbi:hypothetical protein CLV35_1848 [Motilibacter peucedani]|uniref:RsiG-like domain-containing protein n=1 Tax=Motilibacter peucedani TaxID=598650 RepID=A0A420XQ63_9ACTN|nr:hypothetical protein [Motilibacter peucedani]RKS75385.1 hypothetical protein CLV35_1848 [Motilibacter peucedani]
MTTEIDELPVAALGIPPVRRGTRPMPPREADLAHLSLAELRALRAELASEENRVSYWRRLVQARADVLRQQGDFGVDRLREVLSQEQVLPGRTAYVTASGDDLLPPLPGLEAVWKAVDPTDAGGRAALLETLVEMDTTLSTYRHALHQRIDSATRDLVARYAVDPRLCLVALPV